MTKLTLSDLVQKAVALREAKKKLEEAHKARLAPINEAIEKLEAAFARILDAQGVQSLSADGYTVYQSHTTSIKTADKEAFFDFVRANDAWHIADVRPLKSGVEEYIEAVGAPPPGLDVMRIRNINIRKS